jgi:alkylation response protein AidB-like acyl-CoA dehydrogenase
MSQVVELPARDPQAKGAISRPTIEELRKRAQALVQTLRASSEEIERSRRVSAVNMQMLRDADLFSLMRPARYGGFEYGFTELLELGSEIGRGCGSTAWCYGLVVIHQWMLSIFPAEAQEEIFTANPDTIICGSYAPVARAEPVDGGYRIKGRWGFASNCDNADWSLVGVNFPPEESSDGKSVAGFLLVPKSQYEIEDNWHTVGLAGTGSKNVLIREDVFVPAHRKLTFPQAASNNPPGALVNRNPIYRIPFLAAIPVSIIAPALGMVQGALEEFLEMASHRVTRGAVAGGGKAMAEFQTVQLRVAEAAANLDAARLLLLRDLHDVEAGAASGEFISVDKRIRNRRDHAFAVKLCTGAVDALFAAVGGGGMFTSSGIQRAWRDVHAVAKHVSLNWDAVGAMYGQHQLGLVPQGQY